MTCTFSMPCGGLELVAATLENQLHSADRLLCFGQLNAAKPLKDGGRYCRLRQKATKHSSPRCFYNAIALIASTVNSNIDSAIYIFKESDELGGWVDEDGVYREAVYPSPLLDGRLPRGRPRQWHPLPGNDLSLILDL